MNERLDCARVAVHALPRFGDGPAVRRVLPEVRRGREGLLAVTNEKPKPGSKEWQAALDEQIAEHDKRARESGNENQNFEIAPPNGNTSKK